MQKIWLAGASTTLVVVSFAMFGPVLAVLLQAKGYGTAAVGAFAMIAFACVAVLMPFMPRLVSRFGLGHCYLAGMLMETAATLGYSLTNSFAAWCSCAVLGGMGAAAVWNCTESLIAQQSPPALRGRITGLYQTALGGALAAGPFIPALLGWAAPTTLAAAAAIQTSALVMVVVSGVWRDNPAADAHLYAHCQANAAMPAPASSPVITEQAMTTSGAFRAAPVLVAISFVGGVFEVGLSSVSAAHTAGIGLSLAQASSVAGAFGLGSFMLQLPAGMAADRYSQRAVFGMAGVILMASVLAFLLSGAYPWLLWAAAGLWGGVGGALYTLAMIRVAHEFGATAVAAGTAAMITGYTLGGAVGPLVSGAALQWVGPLGLVSWLGVLAAGVVLLSRKLPRPAV